MKTLILIALLTLIGCKVQNPFKHLTKAFINDYKYGNEVDSLLDYHTMNGLGSTCFCDSNNRVICQKDLDICEKNNKMKFQKSLKLIKRKYNK
tara:strand:+ start:1576 stop:1854 length:279 start_codon:yes stop_codon:yes gene_type:complete